jgi:hypothetical protein
LETGFWEPAYVHDNPRSFYLGDLNPPNEADTVRAIGMIRVASASNTVLALR